MPVTIARDDSKETAKAIDEGLTLFNRANGFPDMEPINVALRDEDARIVGGVVGNFGFDSVYIDSLWVDEAQRSHGYGVKMMRMVEDEARRRGAKQVWLYTVTWQAPEFYAKLGYRVFGELPYHRDGHKRIFFWKDL